MKISIFGATGMLGIPVTKEFINKGFEVKILARDTKKAKNLFGENVNIIQGDLANENDIRNTLSGSDAVYMNLSVHPQSKEKDFQPQREGFNTILKISQEENIKLIGHISSIVQFYEGKNGYHWWVFEQKHKNDEALKKSGIPYLIFCPSSFMENFDKGNYRQGKAISLAGRSEHKQYFIAGDDYARMVEKAYENFDGNSKEYTIQGPEAYTTDEATRIFINNYTKESLKSRKVPIGLIKFLGNFSSNMDYVYHIVEALNKYPESFSCQNTWDELGNPHITLKEYAKKAE